MEIVAAVRPFLAVLNGGVLALHQVNVEADKQGNHQRQHTVKDVVCHDEVSDSVIERLRVHQRAHKHGPRRRCNQPTDNHAVEDHAKEELVVVEAYAVGHPRAVVVHLQHALIALRAVVGAVGLSLEAPGAHADAAEFLLLKANDFLGRGGLLALETRILRFRVVGSLALG